MRRHGFLIPSNPFAKNDAGGQSGPSRSHFYHEAAGKIDRTYPCVRIPDSIHPPSAAPHHVSQGKVDNEHPRTGEKKNGGKLHPLCHRTNQHDRRDNREHELVHAENVLGNPIGVIGVWGRRYAPKERELQPAQKGALKTFPENETISSRPPKNRYQSGDSQTLGHDRKNIFRTNQAPVKKGESRKGHK